MTPETIKITVEITLDVLVVPGRPRSSPVVPDSRDDQKTRARPDRPPLTGDEHESESNGTTTNHPRSSQPNGTTTTPWWPSTHDWPYPSPNHPSSQEFPRNRLNRALRCETCGAPPDAHCLTRAGEILSGVHRARQVAAK